MEREGGNGERMRKCRESISLHFLIFSPIPPHFLILSPFPLRFLFISSFSLHFLAARLQGCNDSCSPARAKFLENKIYTEKTRKLRQNTQKIANFLRYYGKIHSKLPIFRVKSVKIYTGQKKFTRIYSWRSWQISGMYARVCQSMQESCQVLPK